MLTRTILNSLDKATLIATILSMERTVTTQDRTIEKLTAAHDARLADIKRLIGRCPCLQADIMGQDDDSLTGVRLHAVQVGTFLELLAFLEALSRES